MKKLYSESESEKLPVIIQSLSEDKTEFSTSGESIVFNGKLFDYSSTGKISYSYISTDEPYLTFAAEMQAEEQTFLSEIQWLNGEFEENITLSVHRTNLNDNFLFVRKNGISFIFSLDFPYSHIDGCKISYNPHIMLEAEKKYTPHSMTVFACRLSGKTSGDFDIAEIEAVSMYIETRFLVRFDKPMNLAAGITNRMTYVQEGRIFYSMHDNPTLTLDMETLLAEIDLCEELMIEYYQVFEGVFDWVKIEETSRRLKYLVSYAASKGIKVGDYVHPGEMYCPHYNYENRICDEADWRIKNLQGQTEQLCLGCDEYLQYLKNRLVKHNMEHGEKLICMDMIKIAPCFNQKHNHGAGDLYKQVLGLVELMQVLNNLSDDYMCWTNSGNWIEFMPKLVWYNQNVYLTDPHPGEYEPVLNALKYLGDCRREQMVSVHEKFMIPYRFFSNCEYYYAPRSRVSDIRMYEYSLLQSLAVTPNICFAEIRTFIERMPYKEVPPFKRFIKKWLKFIHDNYVYWKRTRRCGDAPGVGALEVYSHILKDSGFLCLVNQNTYSVIIKTSFDESIGLTEGEKFGLSEIYPRECLLYEAELPYVSYGDAVEFEITPESVRYIKVEPYTEKSGVIVYGAENRIEKNENGYRIYLKEEQGMTIEIVVLTEGTDSISSVKAYQVPLVKMYNFPSEAKIISRKDNQTKIEVRFPLHPASKEITSWKRVADGKTIQLPRAEFGFVGGLISGMYSEKLEVYVDVTITNSKINPVHQLYCKETAKDVESNVLIHDNQETLSTEFMIPFIEAMQFGAKPSYDNDCIMHLVFYEPGKVKKIRVWLNETEIEVKKYMNPIKREWFSYFIELTDNVNPGLVKMKMEIEWMV